MKRRNVSALVLLLATSPFASAQDSPGTNPLESRARELTRAVNTHDVGALHELVNNSFGGGMSNVPMGIHVWLLMSYWDMSHGLTFSGLENAKPYEAIVRFDNALTHGQSQIFMQIEPAPPHRITTVRAQLEGSAESAPARLSRNRIASEVDSFVQRLVDAEVFSGAVLIADDEGNVVFERAYGLANRDAGTPNTLETKFNLGSMNKMFTAVAIAQLVERGLVSYDDPLSKFVSFPDEETAKRILIRHLISHSSGLKLWWTPRNPNSPPVDFRSVDELLELISPDERPEFPPGTDYQYSNTGFVLLGKVIEVATGMSYYDYVRENILEPAGMTSTTSDRRADIVPPPAIGYRKGFDELGKPIFYNAVPLDAPGVGMPTGGGHSTAADLAKFARALRSSVLLERAHADELFIPRGMPVPTQWYGYGFLVDEKSHIVGHSGGTYGVSNNLDLFLDTGWTSVVLANYTQDTFEVARFVVEKIRSVIPKD